MICRLKYILCRFCPSMELPKLQIPKSYLTAFAGYSCFLITRHLVKVLRQVNWYLVVSSLAFDFFCSCFISPNLVWCDVLWEKVFNGIAGMVLQQWPSCPSFPGVPHQLHSLQLHFIFLLGWPLTWLHSFVHLIPSSQLWQFQWFLSGHIFVVLFSLDFLTFLHCASRRPWTPEVPLLAVFNGMTINF